LKTHAFIRERGGHRGPPLQLRLEKLIIEAKHCYSLGTRT
jgi:hypothetical protein